MSDPRFARLKTDPRFRRIRKKDSKVVVDDRFKSLFDESKDKKGKKAVKGRVDKYGKPLAETHEQDNLRRFYRLQDDEGPEEAKLNIPDYARGGVLLESSDEEDDDSDSGGVVTLGRNSSRPIPVSGALDIDLDEDNFADLDAQAAAYSKEHPQDIRDQPQTDHTRRIAVVNLDWDHVRATHLYKIFSSLVSPTAPPVSEKKIKKSGATNVVRGKVLSVRVYPSEFGKERMAREEKEGPPTELFKKQEDVDENDPRSLYEIGDGQDYDEDALRKYQLERLRYYYAIVECDTVQAASYIYSELEGTELERSANVFDLSFVPDDMSFDDECRDEATDDLNVPYKGLEFVTDALRHSKVKLTWDEDDPERNQITRKTFTRKEVEENDFKAYIASSSEPEDEEEVPSKGKASRDKLRELLLAGNDDTLPEGWGDGQDADDADVDMEVTFTPGLSVAKEDKDETTLEKYQRKAREKKKKRKEERKVKATDTRLEGEDDEIKDDFFGADSNEDEGDEGGDDGANAHPTRSLKHGKKPETLLSESEPRRVSTTEELALIADADNLSGEPRHFSMKAVLKAEKAKGNKKKDKKKKVKYIGGEDEVQEDFSIDVKDDRFKAVHEDSTFAIDPSNPHFKKTKSMSALLEEGSNRRRERYENTGRKSAIRGSSDQLQSLVESVKRKSASTGKPGIGKRRKL